MYNLISRTWRIMVKIKLSDGAYIPVLWSWWWPTPLLFCVFFSLLHEKKNPCPEHFSTDLQDTWRSLPQNVSRALYLSTDVHLIPHLKSSDQRGEPATWCFDEISLLVVLWPEWEGDSCLDSESFRPKVSSRLPLHHLIGFDLERWRRSIPLSTQTSGGVSHPSQARLWTWNVEWAALKAAVTEASVLSCSHITGPGRGSSQKTCWQQKRLLFYSNECTYTYLLFPSVFPLLQVITVPCFAALAACTL